MAAKTISNIISGITIEILYALSIIVLAFLICLIINI